MLGCSECLTLYLVISHKNLMGGNRIISTSKIVKIEKLGNEPKSFCSKNSVFN